MGTKNEPGQFDCHAKAEDDEPLFTLLARDSSAAWFVRMWKHLKNGDNVAFTVAATSLRRLAEEHPKDFLEGNIEKLIEAEKCADNMRRWRIAREHRTASSKET